jgi:hypothetical protein
LLPETVNVLVKCVQTKNIGLEFTSPRGKRILNVYLLSGTKENVRQGRKFEQTIEVSLSKDLDMIHENRTLRNSSVNEKDTKVGLLYLRLVFCAIVMISTIFGNLLVCFAVLLYKNLRTQTNVMLVSLAISDVLMVVSMAFNSTMILHNQWLFTDTMCTVVSSLALTLCFISILHLCLLSIDRYLSIKKPFKHRDLMSKRTVTVLMVLIWLVPSVVVNLPYADFEFRSSVFGCLKDTSQHHNPTSTFLLVVVFVMLPFFVLFYVYVYLFKVVRQHARRILDLQPSQDGANNLRPVLKQEVKSIKTFAFVIGAFLLCYTPFFLFGSYASSRGTDTISDDVMSAVTWLAFCNSFCNPVVYSLRYKHFREAFRKILCSPQTLVSSRRTESVSRMRSVGRTNVTVDASPHVITA